MKRNAVPGQPSIRNMAAACAGAREATGDAHTYRSGKGKRKAAGGRIHPHADSPGTSIISPHVRRCLSEFGFLREVGCRIPGVPSPLLQHNHRRFFVLREVWYIISLFLNLLRLNRVALIHVPSDFLLYRCHYFFLSCFSLLLTGTGNPGSAGALPLLSRVRLWDRTDLQSLFHGCQQRLRHSAVR